MKWDLPYVQEYLSDRSKSHPGKTSEVNAKKGLVWLNRVMGKAVLRDIAECDIVKLRDRYIPLHSRGTLANYFNAIHGYMHWCQCMGYIEGHQWNPDQYRSMKQDSPFYHPKERKEPMAALNDTNHEAKLAQCSKPEVKTFLDVLKELCEKEPEINAIIRGDTRFSCWLRGDRKRVVKTSRVVEMLDEVYTALRQEPVVKLISAYLDTCQTLVTLNDQRGVILRSFMDLRDIDASQFKKPGRYDLVSDPGLYNEYKERAKTRLRAFLVSDEAYEKASKYTGISVEDLEKMLNIGCCFHAGDVINRYFWIPSYIGGGSMELADCEFDYMACILQLGNELKVNYDEKKNNNISFYAATDITNDILVRGISRKQVKKINGIINNLRHYKSLFNSKEMVELLINGFLTWKSDGVITCAMTEDYYAATLKFVSLEKAIPEETAEEPDSGDEAASVCVPEEEEVVAKLPELPEDESPITVNESTPHGDESEGLSLEVAADKLQSLADFAKSVSDLKKFVDEYVTHPYVHSRVYELITELASGINVSVRIG